MKIDRLIRDVLDFCYPSRCARCESPAQDPFLCPSCEIELTELATRPACPICAKPLGGNGGACPYCEGNGIAHFDRIISLGVFRDPLRHLIYAVKYHGRWPLAERLADRLLEQEPVKGLLTETDCLVPVPLHRVRQVARGFNQAEVIASRLAKRCGIKIARPAVRLRKTETQTHLHSRAQREENLQGAFGLINERKIHGKHIVLIDDVMTTGATLQSLARTLKPAKPASICAIVLATADPLGQDFRVI